MLTHPTAPILSTFVLAASAFATPLGITDTDGNPLPSGPFPAANNAPSGQPDDWSVEIGSPPPARGMTFFNGAVTSDPSKKWDKTIQWNPFTNDSDGSLTPGEKLLVIENFTLQSAMGEGMRTISDWHEQMDLLGLDIPTGSLKWGSASFEIDKGNGFQNVGNLMTQSSGQADDAGSKADIDFTFDGFKINETTPVSARIIKEIVYMGPVIEGEPGAEGFEIYISEYPSPTPGTAGAFTLFALTASRRRRSA